MKETQESPNPEPVQMSGAQAMDILKRFTPKLPVSIQKHNLVHAAMTTMQLVLEHNDQMKKELEEIRRIKSNT